MKESMSMRPNEGFVGTVTGQGPNSIVTPEAVALTIDTAGFGSRLGAWLLDALILGAVAGSLGLLGLGGDLGGVVLAAIMLAVWWGYFPFFEEVMGGRTPGKRALGLRVVHTDGQPAGLGAVLLRNLIRPLDMAGLGLLMLVTRRHQRLGDLAAGTMVIRQGRVYQPAPVQLYYPPDPSLPPLDTTLLTE